MNIPTMIMNNDFETSDLLGVGIGPFNLSLAALLSQRSELRARFFDARDSFIWHAGQLLPDAEIQVTHLKDLVTLVDPTNPYSFLAYLKKHKRLYRFINARFRGVMRQEFSQYFSWVSESLPNLSFGESIQDIKFKKSSFVVQTSKRTARGKNLSLGSGLAANIPDSAKPFLGENVYHVKDFLMRKHEWKGKRIALIGGGQSSAELIQSILSDGKNLPSSIKWLSRRSNFAPMDESSFANEIFTPGYSHFFQQQSAERKSQLLREHTLASDGISASLIEEIYQRLYVLECVEQRGRIAELFTGHSLVEVKPSSSAAYELVFAMEAGDKQRVIEADIVILCTGFSWQFPTYLKGLADYIPLEDGKFLVNEDFSIEWEGPSQNKIYVQNAARHSHGVADPNLSLMAWRSATIINSLAGEEIFDLDEESSAMDWSAPSFHPVDERKRAQVAMREHCQQPPAYAVAGELIRAGSVVWAGG